MNQQVEDPRLRLAKILGDHDALRRLDEAADLSGIQPISLYLLASEWRWPIPTGNSVVEFVQSCVRHQWVPIPAGLEPPKSGDLAVFTDGKKMPISLGIVQQAHTEGKWWHLVVDGQFLRQEAPTADYWLRMFCRECEAKKQQEQRARVAVPPSGVLPGVTSALSAGLP